MSLLEPRAHASRAMRLAAPLIATLLTLLTGAALFAALGKPPVEALRVFFIEPLSTSYGWSELLIKACPLILIAQGLAIGFRARIYNIGAEGQLIAGAICGGGVALWLNTPGAPFLASLTLPMMIVAGALGGALWGAIPALLKTRFRADETLTTLMLSYVATQLLGWLVHGPWKDPEGMNFPQTIQFAEHALFPLIWEGLRANYSALLTLAGVLGLWFFTSKTMLAFQLNVGGQAPLAARYAGFSANQAVWVSLLLSGATAGIAGVGEIAGPIGQLNLNISPGYGFAAIIVAYLGRLHPIGIVFSGFLLALIYLGGEAAQLSLQTPAAITGVFQGLLLFFLLGSDVLVDYRFRHRRRRQSAQRSQP